MTRETVQSEPTSVSGMGIALGGYTVLFVLKLVTYFATGIGVMYAEALHSLADMLISGFLLVAALWSRKPADQQFRYGYGRAQNVAALAAATIFISFTALEAFREAVNRLFGAQAPDYANLSLAIGVTLVAIVISALPLVKIWRGKEKGAAARAQYVESINDEVALLAALVGIALVANGVSAADGIASLVVAAVIAVNAGILWWENAQNLMGRAPEPEVLERIEIAARSVNGVLGVHDLRAEMLGGSIHLEMHISVSRGTPVEDADGIAKLVDGAVGRVVSHAFCTIHVDPTKPGAETTALNPVPTVASELEQAHAGDG